MSPCTVADITFSVFYAEMGRRKLRYDVRKNNERKKRYRRAVSLALVDPDNLMLRIPLHATLSSKLSTIKSLHERVIMLKKLSFIQLLYANNNDEWF